MVAMMWVKRGAMAGWLIWSDIFSSRKERAERSCSTWDLCSHHRQGGTAPRERHALDGSLVAHGGSNLTGVLSHKQINLKRQGTVASAAHYAELLSEE